MGYTYHLPTSRNPYSDDVLTWCDSEVEDLIENRKKMKILIATQKPFAAKAVEGMKEIIAEAERVYAEELFKRKLAELVKASGAWFADGTE